jgi:membrane protein
MANRARIFGLTGSRDLPAAKGNEPMAQEASPGRKEHERDEGRATDPGLGRGAERPSDIPGAAWRDILLRTWNAIGEDRLSLLAAGVAFYALFAIFPGLIAVISLFGLLADPAQLQAQLEGLREVLPDRAWEIISEQLLAVASQETSTLSWSGIISLGFALFAARVAAASLMDALNAIYNEDEQRNLIVYNAVALLLTLGAIMGMVLFVAGIVFAPIILNLFGLGGTADFLIRYLRWPLLGLVLIAGLAITYRYAPSRAPAKWRWLTWGAAAAMVLWLIASVGFSWYVEAFGSYDELYGSLGAVIILMFWLWLTAFVVLLGAELDMQIEHQTAVDTTTGPDKPMGERGAYAADTVAKSP